MYWLTLQKHFEHTANLLDDLHKKQEAEYIREVVIPRLHQDSDILQERGKKALYELVQTGDISQRESWVQTLLNRDRQTSDILNKKIDDCELTFRSKNRLMVSGIETIGNLIKHSATDLLKIRNLGLGTLQEIENFLSEQGLELAKHSINSRSNQ